MSDNTKQQGFYAQPAKKDSDECPSCFYQPAAADAAEEEKKEDEEECAQCFYQPEVKVAEEDEKKMDTEDCAQCFYTPSNEAK